MADHPDRHEPRAWLVDKPAGPTSHDIVAGVRRGLPRRTRVGHAGTLDPFATGLIVVLAGRATRLARLLSDQPKRYRATVVLGARSSTGDPEGEITPGSPVPALDDVDAVLAGLTGAQEQTVPAYAAVRVEGQRMYELARRGVEVTRPVRSIVVYDLTVRERHQDRGELVIDTLVSKGTYIRQLAADIGDRLGCGGYCGALRRTAVGALRVDDAVAPERVAPETAIPIARLLGHLPQPALDAGRAVDLAHGRPVADGVRGEALAMLGDRPVALVDGDGSTVRPQVVLMDPAEVAG
ncbi:MAG: tRNA pseudouridine(55) synthase TruB [Thermoleophilia bacterium]